jgi:hypothetical protein
MCEKERDRERGKGRCGWETQWTAVQARLSIHQIFTMALRPRRLRSCSLIGAPRGLQRFHHAIVCLASRLLDSKAHGPSCSAPRNYLFVLMSNFVPPMTPLFAVWELDIVDEWALAEFQ